MLHGLELLLGHLDLHLITTHLQTERGGTIFFFGNLVCLAQTGTTDKETLLSL